MRPQVESAPEPNFAHLNFLTDGHGTFEHALHAEPRPEHGYCTDDVARVLVVASREPIGTPGISRLIDVSLEFLRGAIDRSGRCRNRMNQFGEWTDRPTLDDCWGRSLWGLGTIMAMSEDSAVRGRAATLFGRACIQRSVHSRAMAFAALGAANALDRDPDHGDARRLLEAAADATADRWCCRFLLALAREEIDLRQRGSARGHDRRRIGT